MFSKRTSLTLAERAQRPNWAKAQRALNNSNLNGATYPVSGVLIFFNSRNCLIVNFEWAGLKLVHFDGTLGVLV